MSNPRPSDRFKPASPAGTAKASDRFQAAAPAGTAKASDRFQPANKGILVVCDTCDKVIMPIDLASPVSENVFRCPDCVMVKPIEGPATVPVGTRQQKSGYGIKPGSKSRISRSSIPVVKPSSGRQPSYATPVQPREVHAAPQRSKFFWASIGAGGVVAVAAIIGLLISSKKPTTPSDTADDGASRKRTEVVETAPRQRELEPPKTSRTEPTEAPPAQAPTPTPTGNDIQNTLAENVNKVQEQAKADKPAPAKPTTQNTVKKVDEKKPAAPALTANTFSVKLGEAVALSDARKFGGAQALLDELKTQGDGQAWWKDKSDEFNKASGKFKDAWQALKDEATEAQEESRTAKVIENLDNLTKVWTNLANLNDPETSKLANEVLKQVQTDKSRISAKIAEVAAEEKKKDLEARLTEGEALLKNRPSAQVAGAYLPKLDDVEKIMRGNKTLADANAERYAGIKFDLNQITTPRVGNYKGVAKKNGGALELTYDFAAADQLNDFLMEGGNNSTKATWDSAKQAVSMRVNGKQNWSGNKHGNGIWRFPFNFYKDSWVVEVDALITEDSSNEKNASPGIAVWDGTANNYIRFQYDDDRKNYKVSALGPVNPTKTSENQWKDQPSFASSGTPEKVKLQMICANGGITLNFVSPSKSFTVKQAALTFVPKFVGLYLNTYTASATAQFDNFKLMAVPDQEVLKSQAETERSTYVGRLAAEIKKEAATSTIENTAKNATAALQGDDAQVTNARSWSSLWTVDGKLNGRTSFQEVSGIKDLYKFVPATGSEVALKRTVNLESGKKYQLKISVGSSTGKVLDLAVYCNGKELHKSSFNKPAKFALSPIDLDLSDFAGGKVEIEIKSKSPDGASVMFGGVNIAVQ